MKKYRVGIIGATGMVGQRFVTLLENHPWFEIAALAASGRSAGKPYKEAVAGRWAFPWSIPEKAADMDVMDAADVEKVAAKCDFVFCAVAMDKKATRALEESYAKAETPVVSNNSACRMLPDVPMLIPEINAAHAGVIEAQKKRLGTKRGFIAVKPNCSIQSYVPALTPLLDFGVKAINVCTYQAISGAGKTFERFPEILDNVIPYIGGEEEKSEKEPLKIWGELSADNSEIIPASVPVISAQCLRVPVADGHMAAVGVSFERKPSMDEIFGRWKNYRTVAQELGLPSAPDPFILYMEEQDRPQTRLDRDFERGMGVTVGRLREDPIFDYKFVCLSHNTLRGAAGGGVLSAELLCAKGYIQRKE
ncbi:MAG: aspartate-semialdehyde dehydrogenase [Clostridia bacterium]|nr:aspartate-semialdehyde dehydrogenase [Clostridia bacterium]